MRELVEWLVKMVPSPNCLFLLCPMMISPILSPIWLAILQKVKSLLIDNCIIDRFIHLLMCCLLFLV
jgi:hypothetical protein